MLKLEKYFMDKVELIWVIIQLRIVQRAGLIERRWVVALRHARGLYQPIL
jgi:hypothetical protein